MNNPSKSAFESKSASGSVLEFYMMASKLKDLIRSGWQRWNVDRERLESVAEHVYGTSMLAIAMYSEYYYKIDIAKVVMMIAIHELEEIEISDITPFDGITPEEKKKMGHEAIRRILAPLTYSAQYVKLIEEFDERRTEEAKFAYQCDKLEADLTAFIYDMEKRTLYTDASDTLMENSELRELANSDAKSMSEFFYYYDRSKYDDNFRQVLDRMFYKCNYN